MIYKTPDPPALGISMQEAAQQNYHDTQWDGMRPHGAYRKRNIPPWPEVWFVISLFGVLGSLSCYFRIVPPIPDQIAGGSVLRDVRNEARGKARSTGGKQQQRDYDFMVAWPERNRSIISENRIRFYIEYILLRVTEYVFVVEFIPRLAFVCRATGHCSARAQLWELSSILYPAGVATPLRTDFSSAIQSFESHIVSTLWTAVGIVIVSCCLLSAQAIVLDKGYLAVLGYIGSEWTVVTDADTATLNPWDPKRKYKKGDLVGYGSDVYQATSNSPDGKPIDPRLRSVHKLLSGELGHNATSQVLLQVSKVQLGTTLIYIGLWVMFTLFGYSTDGLLSAVGANLVALYTLSNDGLSHHNELSSLRAEIMVSQQ
jgi:fumarate reductase subunit C